jgi:hypothetical protein
MNQGIYKLGWNGKREKGKGKREKGIIFDA